MKLPFTTEKFYVTRLSFEEIVHELEQKDQIKYFGGLRVDKYGFKVTENKFHIQRYSNGIDALSEYFPSIKGEVVNQNPTRIYLRLAPSYFTIIFFAIIILSFGFAGIFIDNWTINGVNRTPTIFERMLIVMLGSGIPFLWCYLQYIRPIKKAENWIVKRLELHQDHNSS